MSSSGLRQRKRGAGGLANVVDTFKQFDAYAKPMDDFRVKTFSGGAVTLISAILILVLLVSEFIDYRTVQYIPSLRVDPSSKDKMQIFLNMTFPRLPCYMMGVDIMDVAGEHLHDIDHDIFKVRLDNTGAVIHEEKAVLGTVNGTAAGVTTTAVENYCGSCYGGEPPEGKTCCNSCDDVRKSYIARGWSMPNLEEVEQCQREGYSAKIKAQVNEGCLIYGNLLVNRVPGNVHIAPGASFQQMYLHIHDVVSFVQNEAMTFDHIVHDFRFGEMYEGMADVRNPLDGVQKEGGIRYSMFQYYLKVVNTQILYLNNSMHTTNQYSVTENIRDVSPQPGQASTNGLPGVFFNFEISPMQIVYSEYRKSLTHFLTDVCSIVGGIFTVSGIIDSFLYRAEKAVKKTAVNMDLGKNK